MLQDVTSATAYRYGLKDSAGNSMDTLKVIEVPGQGYLGTYHTQVGGVFRVKVATSPDLLTWTYRADLDDYASQPAIARVSDDSFVVAYEKGSGGPVKCTGTGGTGNECLHFRHYASLAALLSAQADREFKASRTLSNCAEGTPNINSVTLAPDIDHSTVSLGFHYFRNCDVDRQATGTLTNFSSWSPEDETHLNTLFEALTPDIGGNVGDRDSLAWNGGRFNIHEAQWTKGDWASWRSYLYDYQQDKITQLAVKTHKGSTAFGNPSFTLVSSPSGRPAIVVTYFIFSEGAASGEGGELLFYREY